MERLFKERKERLDLFKHFRNAIKPLKKIEIPDNLYQSCPHCKQSIYVEDLINNLYVCPECHSHLKISANERIRQICDPKSWSEINRKLVNSECKFEGYQEKIAKNQEATGNYEAVVCGIGRIEGYKAAIGVMDSRFMMGSMGSAVGEKITRLIEYATKKNLPVILFATSGGARMQEGNISLMQMVKTSAALKQLEDKGQVFISVLTNPTTGGVSASFAMLGDLILAEPQCLVGFAGKRVIEKTMQQQLPEHFQSAEFVLECGFIDAIVKRSEMRSTLAKVLKMHERK